MQRYLELFSYRSNVGAQLSLNEVEAVRLFLVECCPDFSSFTKHSKSLLKYIQKSEVLEFTQEDLQEHETGVCLFTKGAPSDTVIIMLAGSVEVISGKESFKTILGPWSILGANMLSSIRSKTYITDFTAHAISNYCRILKLSRSKYYMLLDKEKEDDRNLTLQQLDYQNHSDVKIEVHSRSNSHSEDEIELKE